MEVESEGAVSPPLAGMHMDAASMEGLTEEAVWAMWGMKQEGSTSRTHQEGHGVSNCMGVHTIGGPCELSVWAM